MITRLNHTDPATAAAIRAVWQVSYPVEAELLGVTDFPPLQRDLAGFTTSANDFYGYDVAGQLAGVVEVDDRGPATHLQSLVVDPAFFRRGIASRLIEFVLANYTAKRYTVETGAANEPAIRLYRKFGFAELYTYVTEHGIRKVRMGR
jgi:ribosomal protein S18 acetylase RimI-like enzyme